MDVSKAEYVVNPQPLSIESLSNKLTYNGKVQKYPMFKVTGLVSNHKLVVDNSAGIRNAGETVENKLEYSILSGQTKVDLNNYHISESWGWLDMNKLPIQIVATTNKNIPFDGSIHTEATYTVQYRDETSEKWINIKGNSGEDLEIFDNTEDIINVIISGQVQYVSDGTVENKVESWEFKNPEKAENYLVTTANGELAIDKNADTITIQPENIEGYYTKGKTWKPEGLSISGGTVNWNLYDVDVTFSGERMYPGCTTTDIDELIIKEKSTGNKVYQKSTGFGKDNFDIEYNGGEIIIYDYVYFQLGSFVPKMFDGLPYDGYDVNSNAFNDYSNMYIGHTDYIQNVDYINGYYVFSDLTTPDNADDIIAVKLDYKLSTDMKSGSITYADINHWGVNNYRGTFVKDVYNELTGELIREEYSISIESDLLVYHYNSLDDFKLDDFKKGNVTPVDSSAYYTVKFCDKNGNYDFGDMDESEIPSFISVSKRAITLTVLNDNSVEIDYIATNNGESRKEFEDKLDITVDEAGNCIIWMDGVDVTAHFDITIHS